MANKSAKLDQWIEELKKLENGDGFIPNQKLIDYI